MLRIFAALASKLKRDRNGPLIFVQDLFAVVEGVAGSFAGLEPAPEADRAVLLYSPVLALQSYTDETGMPQVRAWLSGTRPIPSDRFGDFTNRYFINHYRFGRPERSRIFIYA